MNLNEEIVFRGPSLSMVFSYTEYESLRLNEGICRPLKDDVFIKRAEFCPRTDPCGAKNVPQMDR
jgi:hypothetical protein